jgi:hypothetical protein
MLAWQYYSLQVFTEKIIMGTFHAGCDKTNMLNHTYIKGIMLRAFQQYIRLLTFNSYWPDPKRNPSLCTVTWSNAVSACRVMCKFE